MLLAGLARKSGRRAHRARPPCLIVVAMARQAGAPCAPALPHSLPRCLLWRVSPPRGVPRAPGTEGGALLSPLLFSFCYISSRLVGAIVGLFVLAGRTPLVARPPLVRASVLPSACPGGPPSGLPLGSRRAHKGEDKGRSFIASSALYFFCGFGSLLTSGFLFIRIETGYERPPAPRPHPIPTVAIFPGA